MRNKSNTIRLYKKGFESSLLNNAQGYLDSITLYITTPRSRFLSSLQPGYSLLIRSAIESTSANWQRAHQQHRHGDREGLGRVKLTITKCHQGRLYNWDNNLVSIYTLKLYHRAK